MAQQRTVGGDSCCSPLLAGASFGELRRHAIPTSAVQQPTDGVHWARANMQKMALVSASTSNLFLQVKAVL